jgi:hypothetical protein
MPTKTNEPDAVAMMRAFDAPADDWQHFISASASFALAEDFGRDVRNLMKSEEYAQVFDVQLAER